MKNYSQEPLLIPNCYHWAIFHPVQASHDDPKVFLSPFSLPLFMKFNIEAETSYALPDIQTEHFASRIDNIIVVGRKNEQKGKKEPVQGAKYLKIKESQKECKKVIQKDSRNVFSNILRIFLRNLFETQRFESLVDLAIKNYKIPFTKQQFYSWLRSFNINYKNYIRLTQLRNIFKDSSFLSHQKLLLMLLNRYLSNDGITHCLTSKRIQPSSIKMHLLGLRNLRSQLLKLKNLNKH